jgi:8-oxo-dGTP pyrophosphatase MutT (NUDIX family)
MTDQTPATDDSPFTLLGSSIAWECPYYAIRQDRLRLPDGSERRYHVVAKCDAVWILPVTPAGEIVLIRHYRPALRAWCLELPAGGIDDGLTPLQTAQKELREEIGGVAKDWRFLIKVSVSNGLTNEHGYVFLATGVTLGETHHEPLEVLTIHPTPLDRALRMARAGEINDALSVMALLLAEGELRIRSARP